MSIELVEKMILIIFLLIFTFQDIRKKEIYTFGVVLFYIMIIDIQIYKFIIGNSIDIKNTVLGILSGFLLLPLSKFNILGEGDALVFIGCGAILGLKGNILLFFVSVFIVSIYALYALFMSLYYMIKKRRIKGVRVAMLPFITMANCIIWLCV